MLESIFDRERWKDQYVVSRLIAMVMGNVVMCLGHACFNLSKMGMHPFNSCVMAVSEKVGVDYGTLLMAASILLLVVQFIWGRHYIGAGTIFNWVMTGYITIFWSGIVMFVVPVYEQTVCRYLFLVAGVLLMSLGLSVYQSADMGISPFDSASMILSERTGIKYSLCRLFTDALAAVAAFVSGGILGLGSILCVFCLGPFIAFFNRTFSDRYLSNLKKVREMKKT